jgi:hypothetical protein
MSDPPREIDDGVPEAAWMVERQDRLEIPQQQLLYEFLE